MCTTVLYFILAFVVTFKYGICTISSVYYTRHSSSDIGDELLQKQVRNEMECFMACSELQSCAGVHVEAEDNIVMCHLSQNISGTSAGNMVVYLQDPEMTESVTPSPETTTAAATTTIAETTTAAVTTTVAETTTVPATTTIAETTTPATTTAPGGNISPCSGSSALVDNLSTYQFTASSYYGSDRPEEARMQTADSWCSRTAPSSGEWLQVDLGADYVIEKVETKGQPWSVYAFWVKKYELSYKADAGTGFVYYEEGGASKLFSGNNDGTTKVRWTLTQPFTARMVRFVVRDYQPASTFDQACANVELYGCPA